MSTIGTTSVFSDGGSSSSVTKHTIESLFNGDFDKYAKDKNIRFGKLYTDFNTQIDYFDVAKLPDPESATLPLHAHMFMTRPELNIDTGSTSWGKNDANATANWDMLRSHPMTAAFANDAYCRQMLEQLLSTNLSPSSPWIPLFTSKAMSYSVADFSLKTVDKSSVYFGNTIRYAKHNEEHKFGGTMSIEFRNDMYLSMLKMIYMWCSYIYLVSKTDLIIAKDRMRHSGILDYAASIYYLVTDSSNDTLVYWEKLVGVFPKSAPFSMFSYSDSPIIPDTFTVDFDYAMRSDPCDLNVILDINMWSKASYISGGALGFAEAMEAVTTKGLHTDNIAYPNSKETPFGRGGSFATRPIIHVKTADSSSRIVGSDLTYHLQFLKKEAQEGSLGVGQNLLAT